MPEGTPPASPDAVSPAPALASAADGEATDGEATDGEATDVSVGQTADRRIAALELALDEALTVLQQLRSQLKDQQVLEGQLARLEDFSNMQHQAIGELKHQLTQILSLGLGSDRLLRQARSTLAGLDTQGLTTQSIEETGLHATAAPDVAAAWEAAESATTIAALQQALATAHQQIHALETQIARQTVMQATLQQACQELELEREQQGKRLQSLEQQQAEMQEQILKQVRQAQEYETAIQHWQTRCVEGQQQAQQLEALVQQLATHLTAPSMDAAATVPEAQTPIAPTIAHLQTHLAQLLATLTPAAVGPRSEGEGQRGTTPSSSALAPKPVKVDLPNFLSRRP